jgi:hypothetical protein
VRARGRDPEGPLPVAPPADHSKARHRPDLRRGSASASAARRSTTASSRTSRRSGRSRAAGSSSRASAGSRRSWT